MSDARTLSRTDYTFRARGHFALSQDEAWDRMTQQWLPAWLGLPSIPLMVGGPLVKNPGKNRQIIGRCSARHSGTASASSTTARS